MHQVAILALDAVVPVDLAIPAQIFNYGDEAPYRATVCALEPGSVRSTGGYDIVAIGGLAAVRRADTVIVPGFWPHARPPAALVLDAIRSAHARERRVVSICTGAFALAAAGVLDGRCVTTHWRHADELAALYPAVEVNPNVLYVDDGRVLTSAGVAAGFDLCLHLVRLDHGAAVANRIARRLVVAPHRDGGQTQYIDRPVQHAIETSLQATRGWALQRLDEPLTVSALARHACVSERTFTRRFSAETGTTPLQWLLHQRVLAARRLLETSTKSIDEVAERCGFGTAASLRAHFRRFVATTPTDYRRAFAERGDAAGAAAT